MRKALRRRPGFEALESMTLLSGVAGAAVSAPAPDPIHLTGSFAIELGAHHRRLVSKGSGSISPLGRVTDSNSKDAESFFAYLVSTEYAHYAPDAVKAVRASSPLVFTAKAGKVFVSVSKVTIIDGGFAGQYTITGGTKAYAGATGSGNVLIPYATNTTITVNLS